MPKCLFFGNEGCKIDLHRPKGKCGVVRERSKTAAWIHWSAGGGKTNGQNRQRTEVGTA